MRREFPKSIKVQVVRRATHDFVVYCEKCHLPTKKFQIDHVIPDAIGGMPIIGNAELICEACYSVKNPQDTSTAAKTKRIEAKNIGIKSVARWPIQSRGFAKTERQEPAKANRLSMPPRRSIYRSV
jgi:5-methylcytosine-specific restriction enzyme A